MVALRVFPPDWKKFNPKRGIAPFCAQRGFFWELIGERLGDFNRSRYGVGRTLKGFMERLVIGELESLERYVGRRRDCFPKHKGGLKEV